MPSYEPVAVQPRRSAARYNADDAREDLTFIRHPGRALAVLPRTPTGRISVKRSFSAWWTYNCLSARWWAARQWTGLLVMAVTALSLGAVGLATRPEQIGRMIAISGTGLTALYVYLCVHARRIGLLMANRYVETELPQRR